MVNVLRHCWNLHDSTFIRLIGHRHGNCAPKSRSYWHAKSWECLLTYWLPMKSYPVLSRENLTIPIQMQESQKHKFFSQFFAKLLKSRLNLKSSVSEDALTNNMVNVPKHCWNLHQRLFIKLIDHCQVNWVGKGLSYWHPKPWDCLLRHSLQMKSILFIIETI